MRNNFLLEITVESVPRQPLSAVVPIASNCAPICVAVASLLPREIMHNARSAVRLPIFAMVRPRADNFVYTNGEISLMKSQMTQARALGMNGIVLGVLREDNTVDVSLLKNLVEFAAPLPLTFHRAFDETPDLFRALEDITSVGAARILTSGGASKAPQALDTLAELVQVAGGRIIIVPGSGIRPENFGVVRQALNAREYHSGLSSVLPYGCHQPRPLRSRRPRSRPTQIAQPVAHPFFGVRFLISSR